MFNLLNNIGARSSSSAGAIRHPQPKILLQQRLAEAQAYEDDGRLQEAEKEYQELIKEIEGLGDKDTLLDAYLKCANFLSRCSRENDAAFYFEKINQLIAAPLQNNSLLPPISKGIAVGLKSINLVSVANVQAPLPGLAQTSFFFAQPPVSTSQKKNSQETEKALKNKAYQVLDQFRQSKTTKFLHLHELVVSAPIDNLSLHRQITNTIRKRLDLGGDSLLDLKFLQAVSVMYLNRSNFIEDPQFVGDCFVLLKALLKRLKDIPVTQNSLQVQALLQTISLLLKQMVSAEVKGIEEHAAFRIELAEALDRLKENRELIWQIEYAQQSLIHLSDNQKFWDALGNKIGQHLPQLTEGILHGVGGVLKLLAASMANPTAVLSDVIIAGLEPDRFINAMANIRSGLHDIFPKQRASWYEQLRMLDMMLVRALEAGRLDLIELALSKDAQSNAYAPEFLFGWCDLLEHLACAQLEESVQEGALRMLEAIARGNIPWAKGEAVELYAQTIQTRIKEWKKLTLETVDNEEIAPPAWSEFWKKKSKGELLKKEQDKIQRRMNQEALFSQVTGLQQDVTALNTQTTQILKAGFANITIDAAQSMQQMQAIALNISNIAQQIHEWNIAAISARSQSFAQLDGLDNSISLLRTDHLNTLSKSDVISNARKNYIAPKGQVSASSEKRFDLLDKVQEFLLSDKEVFLLLGEAGSGKSTFNRYLTEVLWQAYEKDTSQPIPLFIALAQFPSANGVRDLIKDYLLSKKLTELQIEALRQQQSFILILDGVDEIKDRNQGFHPNNRLGLWEGNKIIISCRSEYWDEGHSASFRDPNRSNSLQECWLARISADWIKQYIGKYAQHNEPVTGWNAERYEKELDELHDLKGVISNPFLLGMALDIFPTLTEQERAGSMNRLALYEMFVQRWWVRARERLQQIDLPPEEKEARAKLGGNLVQKGLRATQEMAVSLTQAQAIQAVYEAETGFAHPPAWLPYFEGSAEKHLLFLHAPLTRNGLHVQFIHKSLQDYFVARAICGPKSMLVPFEAVPDNQAVQERGMYKLEPSKQKKFVLNDVILTDEPLILQFLVDRAREQPKFKASLHECLNASKKKKWLSRAAANAIELLVRSGEEFRGQDLAGITIPGADLSYGNFDRADLTGANMEGVKAIKTWFREAKLMGANLSNIHFGEMPSIKGDEKVSAIAYSRNGAFLAVGWWEGRIDIYQVATGQKILTTQGARNRICSLDFSADGERLAAAGEDSKVYVVDIIKGVLTHILEGHVGAINAINFSTDGKYIVAAGDDSIVRVWSSAEGRLIHQLKDQLENQLEGQTAAINSVSFSADGKYIAAAGQDHQIRVWDSIKGTLINRLQGHTEFITSVDFSADGRFIASGSRDFTVGVWDREKKAPLHILKGHTRLITSVRFSADSTRIVSADGAGTICMWDVQKAHLLEKVDGNFNSTDHTILSVDTRFAAVKEHHRVELWKVDTSAFQKEIDGHRYEVNAVSTSANSPLVISGSDDGKIGIWNAKTAQLQATLSHPEWNERWQENRDDCILAVSLSPDGRYIASAGLLGRLVVWEAATNQRLPNWEDGKEFPHTTLSINFSANGKLIVTGGEDGKIRLWDTETSALLWISEDEIGEVYSVNFSADGERFVSGSEDGKIRIWGVGKDKPLWVAEAATEEVYSVNFSADDQFVVSGGEDNLVRIWKTEKDGSLKIAQTLVGHTSAIYSVSFSADRKFIASGSRDKTVRVWQAKEDLMVVDGQSSMSTEGWQEREVLVIQGSQGKVNAVGWQKREAGDDYALAAGDGTGALIFWRLQKTEKGLQANLDRATGWSSLAFNGADCAEVKGLNEVTAHLLEQRGARNVPLPTLTKPNCHTVIM